MLNTRRTYSITLITASIFYVVAAIFSFIAYHGGSTAFLVSYAQFISQHMTEITPNSSIFSLWCINVAYQFVWLLYSLVTLFRGGHEATIQSTHTVLFFLLYTCSMLASVFTWATANLYWSFALSVLGQYFLNIAYGYACADLRFYFNHFSVTVQNSKDIWAHRFLIQNGLAFTATMNMMLSLLAMATFLTYELGVSSEVSSMATLIILGLVIITWFVIENTWLRDDTQFTFMNYIVLIGSFIAIHKRTSQLTADTYGLSSLVIGLLAITCCLFFIRLLLLFFKSYDRTQPRGEHIALTSRQMARGEDDGTSVKVYRSFTTYQH